MAIETVKEAVMCLILEEITQECNNLCKKTPKSLFRHIPVEQMANFCWSDMMNELKSIAPTTLRVVSTIAVRNDHRKQNQVQLSHYPGICAAIAVMLKERNKDMCGMQSILSLLMYSCHCEKQVLLHAIASKHML